MINEKEIRVTISELCITDQPLTIQEAETLMEFSVYLSGVRKETNKPLLVSKKSGHRPKKYEISKGRSGNSEHSTFNIKGRGAVDIVFDKDQVEYFRKDGFFTRVCYYPNNGFVHCDRRPDNKGYFEAASPTSAWVYKSEL